MGSRSPLATNSGTSTARSRSKWQLAERTHWHESVRRRIEELVDSGALFSDIDLDRDALGIRSRSRLWMSVVPPRVAQVRARSGVRPDIPFVAATTGTTNLIAALHCEVERSLYEYIVGEMAALDGLTHIKRSRSSDPAARRDSTQKTLPVGRNPAGWSRHRLVDRMVQWGREARSFDVLVRAVVPEPVFAWLEAADDGVTGRVCMRGRVFLERVVTTPDMTALGAAAQVQPPTTGREALDAAGSARRYVRNDVRRRHLDPAA